MEDGSRRKIVLISNTMLHMLLTKGTIINAVCVCGIPEHARFVGMYQDIMRHAYGLVFESDEWEIVPLGAMLPYLHTTYRSIEDLAGEVNAMD